jgi:hypothetical protein
VTGYILIVLMAWLVTVPAVLGLARLLGRVSTPKVPPVVDEPRRRDANVVALVSRPCNDLVRDERRAA